MDSDRNNVYHVTVQASDGNNISRHDVTVTVTNVEEVGTVELSSVQPEVDTPITATLTDPDEVVSGPTWVWQRSNSRSSGWSTISDENSDSYTPVNTDAASTCGSPRPTPTATTAAARAPERSPPTASRRCRKTMTRHTSRSPSPHDQSRRTPSAVRTSEPQ